MADPTGGYVHLTIDIKKDDIHFRLTNNKGKQNKAGDGKRSGFSLENVRRRLDLQYGTDYSHHITEREEEYSVSLTLIKR